MTATQNVSIYIPVQLVSTVKSIGDPSVFVAFLLDELLPQKLRNAFHQLLQQQLALLLYPGCPQTTN